MTVTADEHQALERRARRWAVAAALLALLGHAVVLASWPAAHTLLIDLQVYRAGAEHLVAGQPLYAGGVLLDLPFVYPPFAAAVFVPMLVLPLPALKLLWTACSLALLGYVGHRSLRSMGVPPGPVLGWSVVGLVALASWLDPVRTTLYLGQINIVVLALVLADGLGRPGSRWRGVGIGLAAALKLTPLLFVAYLLVLRRWRAAATALGDVRAGRGGGRAGRPGGVARLLVGRHVRGRRAHLRRRGQHQPLAERPAGPGAGGGLGRARPATWWGPRCWWSAPSRWPRGGTGAGQSCSR